MRRLFQRANAFLDLREQAICDVLGQHDFACGWGTRHFDSDQFSNLDCVD